MIHLSQTVSLDADVLIAGAGPAGASAAAHLARAGQRVLLLDFQQFPRDKVCGDFVGPVAIQELDRLGVRRFFPDEYLSSNVITHAAVFLNGRELVNHPIPEIAGLPSFGRVVPRETLDWWLLEIARKSGAQVIEQCRVTNFEVFKTHVEVICKGKAGEKRFKVRALLGADGSSSTIARVFSGNKHSSQNKILAVRAYFDDTEGPSQRADLYFTADSFPGYYWFFPTGKSTANVGVGMVLETFPKNEAHLNELLQDLLKKDPMLRERVGRGKLRGKIVGWPLATFDPGLPLVGDRLILAGDAAGLINSLNGEGIQYALLSGRWAAETLLECLKNDTLSANDLGKYQQTVERELGYDMMLARSIIEFIRNRTLTPVWLQLLDSIAARARIDSNYASIAGGVLAGIVPAYKVLNPGFLVDSAFQIGFSAGMQSLETIVGGPDAWRQTAQSLAQFSSSLARHGQQSPADYLNWFQGLGRNSFELSKRMWNHAFQKNDSK